MTEPLRRAAVGDRAPADRGDLAPIPFTITDVLSRSWKSTAAAGECIGVVMLWLFLYIVGECPTSLAAADRTRGPGAHGPGIPVLFVYLPGSTSGDRVLLDIARDERRTWELFTVAAISSGCSSLPAVLSRPDGAGSWSWSPW